MIQLHHRAMGALVGSAVGDALGAPFEFGPAGRYTQRFPQPVLGGIGEMVGGGPWAPGEFTDDTQMALALAESLLAHGRVDTDDLWVRWRAWAADAADVGNITRAALRPTEWRGAAEAAHLRLGRSAGNGTLMRVTPIALAFHSAGTEATMQAAIEQSELTHHDPAAGWGAAIGAELIRRALLGLDPIAEIDDVLGHLPAEHRDRYATMLDADWQPNTHTTEPGNGAVWTCLAQAVWAVRHHPPFAEAVTAAIDLGDDTDTVACVAGALAGARNGIQAIPCRWTTYVHGRVRTVDGDRRYDNAALQKVARRLVGTPEPGPPRDETTVGPTEIAPSLWAADLSGARDAADRGFAVLSLCQVGDSFANVPNRREVYLIDQKGNTVNPSLGEALTDAVDTVDAWLDEGRQVLVHCHGGRSRTALVLKAWAMRHHGWDEAQAHAWMTDVWPRYAAHNPTFIELLRESWPA